MPRSSMLALIALLAVPQTSYAYIDPGTGSLILQGLVAMFVGAAFTLKSFFRQRIKPVIDWILRRPRREAAPEERPADGDKP